MRMVIAAVLVMLSSVHIARAQGPNPDFVHGRDYVFNRMEATRPVKHDRRAAATRARRVEWHLYRGVRDLATERSERRCSIPTP